MPSVLIVEDEPTVAGRIRQLLEIGGCIAITLGGAEAALAFLREARVDLVIADSDLGEEMDGEALARVIQTHGPSCPVLLIGSRADAPPVSPGATASVLPDSFSDEVLIAAVKRSIDGSVTAS